MDPITRKIDFLELVLRRFILAWTFCSLCHTVLVSFLHILARLLLITKLLVEFFQYLLQEYLHAFLVRILSPLQQLLYQLVWGYLFIVLWLTELYFAILLEQRCIRFALCVGTLPAAC